MAQVRHALNEDDAVLPEPPIRTAVVNIQRNVERIASRAKKVSTERRAIIDSL